MKKLTTVEIAVVLFALITFIIYLIPNIINTKDEKIISQLKASNAVFTSKVVEEFAHNKNALSSDIAKKIVEELNKTEKNPYKKDEDLYVLNKDCSACSNVEYDDSLKMIIVTTLDKNGVLVARTVIKPPSFVTYYKDDTKE